MRRSPRSFLKSNATRQTRSPGSSANPRPVMVAVEPSVSPLEDLVRQTRDHEKAAIDQGQYHTALQRLVELEKLRLNRERKKCSWRISQRKPWICEIQSRKPGVNGIVKIITEKLPKKVTKTETVVVNICPHCGNHELRGIQETRTAAYSLPVSG
ncbi:MAG: hypothetical protein PHF57_11995 [Methanoregula sp.]|nr:hypothetical protein [Methanoregula sp.]